jgi:hypothetical protein
MGKDLSVPFWGLFLVISQHSVAEKVRTIRKYRSRPLCEYPGLWEAFGLRSG